MVLANQRLLNEASPVGLPGVFDWPLCGEEAGCGGRFKKSASGYGKYGTKQDCIEGALEELDTMIKHYNLICMKKLGNK